MSDKILMTCRRCGKPQDHWALENQRGREVAVQAWCPECCLEEFDEHDFFTEETYVRYCRRCATQQTPEEIEEYYRDLADWEPFD